MHHTSYIIGVRAYTSIGPGEWIDREYTTAQLRKLKINILPPFIYQFLKLLLVILQSLKSTQLLWSFSGY